MAIDFYTVKFIKHKYEVSQWHFKRTLNSRKSIGQERIVVLWLLILPRFFIAIFLIDFNLNDDGQWFVLTSRYQKQKRKINSLHSEIASKIEIQQRLPAMGLQRYKISPIKFIVKLLSIKSKSIQVRPSTGTRVWPSD